MTSLELRRQLVHLGVILFAVPVPFIGSRWSALVCLGAIVFNWVVLPLTGQDKLFRRDGERFLNGVRVYPVAVLLLVVLFPLKVAVASWAVLAVGDAFSNLIGRRFGRVKLPWNPQKSWAGTIGFFVTAAPTAALFFLFAQRVAGADTLWSVWDGQPILAEFTAARCFVIGAVGAAIGAIAESLPVRLDDNLTVSITSGAAMAFLPALLPI